MCLGPILHRAQAVQFHFDALIVVVIDVLGNADFQILGGFELPRSEELAFERSKEALHCSVVEAIALARHALRDAVAFEMALIGRHLIMPTLVRM